MCTSILMHGAKGTLKGLKKARAARLRRAVTASDSDNPAEPRVHPRGVSWV